MDARARRMVGWAIALVGFVVLVVGGLADQVGLGGEGPDEFGSKQVIAVVVGAALIVAGLVLVLVRPARDAPEATEPDRPVG